jgi:hypothetical protein
MLAPKTETSRSLMARRIKHPKINNYYFHTDPFFKAQVAKHAQMLNLLMKLCLMHQALQVHATPPD